MKGEINIGSKEDRTRARIKLAQKGLLGFNELSAQAHPGGSVDAVRAGNLDVKPTAPFAAFHVPKDIKEEMLEVANMPPRVRKQAEMIQNLVSQGRIQSEDVDDLASYGVDGEAIKYWKQFWGQAGDSESKEFAGKLVAEHANNKQAEEMQSYKGRIKRSYEMATSMLSKGIISEAQMESQVQDIMKWNDDAFTSFSGILAKQPTMNKQASVPFVGMLDSGSVILPSVQGVEQANGSDIKGFFDSYFAQKGLKF